MMARYFSSLRVYNAFCHVDRGNFRLAHEGRRVRHPEPLRALFEHLKLYFSDVKAGGQLIIGADVLCAADNCPISLL